MDNSNGGSLSADDPLSGPEFDGHGFDANEEVLLLQMTETIQDVVSPNLQAVLYNQVDFAWAPGQRPQSPLFLERPRSRGIETAAFSFAKPAQNGKSFSLQPALKRTSSGANEATPNQDERILASTSADRQSEQAEVAAHPCTRDSELPAGSHKFLASTKTFEQRRNQDEPGLRPTTRDTNGRPGSRHESDGDIEKAQPCPPGPQHNEHQLSPEAPVQGTAGIQNNIWKHEQPPSHSRDEEASFSKASSFETLKPGQNDIVQSRPDNNQWKIAKRRHGDKKKAANRVSYAPSGTNTQVPEEALFQQLINRLRAREESEAVASNMQKEMEANMAALREENAILKEDLELLSSKLQQRTAEVRTYKSQTDSWKSKLAKVKVFLNELGTGYQNLRGEAIHFKATRKTLDKERKEIAESLENVKERMSQISQASSDRRGCLTDAESLITSLGQKLKHTRERVQYSQNQLVDEKKRSRLLELYIQNCSRAQDKKLDLVKANQLEMLKSLESAIQDASKIYEASYTVISDGFEHRFDDLLAQIGVATKDLSDGKMDVQQCKEVICAFESRMDLITRQLETGIESHSKNADGLMQSLEEQVQSFKDSLSDGSSLFEQLSSSEGRCSQLQTKLEETAPLFDKLELCVDALQKREDELGRRMGGLEVKLSEVKLPERFEDDYVHISVKLGLENEIQQLALTLKSTEEKLEAQQAEIERKQDELRGLTTRMKQIRELTARSHQAETNVARLEIRAASLQQRIEDMEREAPENIERATADSKERCAVEFERRLQEQRLEKAKIEADRQRVENERDELRRRLLVERQKRIEDLEASRAEQIISMTKQAAEMEQMRTREAALTAQLNSLLGKFDEVHGRLNNFQLSRKTKEDYLSTLQAELARKREDCQDLQDSIAPLRDQLVERENEYELVQTKGECKTLQASAEHQALHETLTAIKGKLTEKEEEFDAVNKKLEHARSAQSSLESGKSKAKAEIVSLLKRVQESESDVKKVMEVLHQMDIAQPGQPLPESLEQLKRTLQATTATEPALDRQDVVQVRTPVTSARARNSQTQIGPQNPGEAEINTHTNGLNAPANDLDEPSPSKQAGSIVPFSSILDGLSPTHFSITDNEPFDLSGVLTQTPVKASAPGEPSAPAKPEKTHPLSTFAKKMKDQEVEGQPELERVANTQETASIGTQEQVRQSLPDEQGRPKPHNPAAARKVSFVTQKSAAETGNLQVPDSQEKTLDNELLGPSLESAHPARTNRWTYSKRQRETSTKQHETTSAERLSPQKEDQETRSKKAKTSSTTSAVTQTRTAIELYGRRKSPARWASGSSRPASSTLIPHQPGASGIRRRSVRRTRGDKYNARFSQGT
ncbi:hypothetical protein BDV06DRAFT_234204 [Aspergillus oleicola]